MSPLIRTYSFYEKYYQQAREQGVIFIRYEVDGKPVVEKTISYEGQDGKTALELLDEKYDIKTEQSSIGVFVTSIDGDENTFDKYWMFYIDDQLAPVGAEAYQTKADEKIEWRYEKLQ